MQYPHKTSDFCYTVTQSLSLHTYQDFRHKSLFVQLRRALVQDMMTGKNVPSEDRISKSATIIEKNFKISASISRRAMHMTGLSMEKTPEIQIANYGIGGYYLPHYDFVHVISNNSNIILIEELLTSYAGSQVFGKMKAII